MIKTAVTVSLVEQARGGPFVFWDGLDDAFTRARQIGYDAVEIFAPGPDAVDRSELKKLVDDTGLAVAAVGTGAGMVMDGLSLTDPDESKRSKAKDFVKAMIEFGAEFEAPAIIGSMQGRHGNGTDKPTAVGYLAEALGLLGDHAKGCGLPLIYEPLNRYETNLCNTIADGCDLLKQAGNENVKLLADLFHMNIEESNVAAAIGAGSAQIGHVHFVDSTRWAAGFGHTDFQPIAAALKDAGYDGYLAIEAFAQPDSQTAAERSFESIRSLFG